MMALPERWQPGSMATDTRMRFAVLGDSIAYGQGATRATETAGARLAARLGEAGTAAEPRGFAASRGRSDGLAAQVRRAVDWGAELALVIIGANDLTRLVPPDTAAAQLGDAVGRL